MCPTIFFSYLEHFIFTLAIVLIILLANKVIIASKNIYMSTNKYIPTQTIHMISNKTAIEIYKTPTPKQPQKQKIKNRTVSDF